MKITKIPVSYAKIYHVKIPYWESGVGKTLLGCDLVAQFQGDKAPFEPLRHARYPLSLGSDHK